MDTDFEDDIYNHRQRFEYRYDFIKRLHQRFPQFVDGAVLWSYLPFTPKETDTTMFHNYQKRVLDKVQAIYCACEQTKSMVNARVTLYYVKHYIKSHEYDKCLGWFEGVICAHKHQP